MIYAIGDIHGCLDPLVRLMGCLKIRGDDELVFLGDYIDRGPDSKEVVDYLLSLKGNCKFLLGNHERMFLDYLAGKDQVLFIFNGGYTTLASYGEPLRIPPEHLEFFSSLLPYYEKGNYLFVHGGIRPEIPLEEQDIEDLVWIREEFIGYPGRFPKTVIFGHTPLAEVLLAEDRIGIDTGCVYGGKLTCLTLPFKDLIQVDTG